MKISSVEKCGIPFHSKIIPLLLSWSCLDHNMNSQIPQALIQHKQLSGVVLAFTHLIIFITSQFPINCAQRQCLLHCKQSFMVGGLLRLSLHWDHKCFANHFVYAGWNQKNYEIRKRKIFYDSLRIQVWHLYWQRFLTTKPVDRSVQLLILKEEMFVWGREIT